MSTQNEIVYSIKIIGTDKEVNTIKGLKEELKAVNDSLENAKIGSEQYNLLSKQAAQLTVELGKVAKQASEAQKAAGDSNQSLSATLRSVSGISSSLTSGYTTLKSFVTGGKYASAEMQNLAKVIEGVKAASEIAGAVEEAVALKNIALSKIVVAQKTLEGAAESENIVVRYAAIAAQTVLNAVVAANPFGLLAAALVGVIALVASYSGSTAEATTAQLKFNDAVKQGDEELDRSLEADKTLSDSKVKMAEQNIELLKAQKASTEEIRKAEHDLGVLRVNAAASQAVILADQIRNFTNNKQFYLDQQKALSKNIKELEDAFSEGNSVIIDGKNVHGEELKKKIDVVKGAYENLSAEIIRVQQVSQQGDEAGNDQLVKDLEDQRAARQEALNESVNGFKLLVAGAKESSKEQLDARVGQIKAEAALRIEQLANDKSYAANRALIEVETTKQIRLEVQKNQVEDLENAKKNFDAKNLLIKQGTEEELGAKIESLNKQMEIDKAALKNTAFKADEEARIDAEGQKKIADLRIAYAEKLAQQQLAAETAVQKTKIAQAVKGSEEELNAKLELLDLETGAQVAAATKDIQNEKDKLAIIDAINAESNKKRADLMIAQVEFTKKQRADEINVEANHQKVLNDLIINSSRSTLQEKQQAKAANLQIQLQGLKDEEANVTASYKKEIALAKENGQDTSQVEKNFSREIIQIKDNEAKVIQSIDEDEFQRKKDNIGKASSYLDEAAKVVGQIGSIVGEFEQRATDEQDKQIEVRKNKISDLEDKVEHSTGRQKQLYQKQLDAEKDALKKAEADKEQTRLKYARAQKAIDIIQATISGASMALQAYNDGLSVGGPAGLVLGPVMAAVAAAFAAVQIGLIASRPLARGGHLDGDLSAYGIPSGAGMIQGPSHGGGGVKFKYKGRLFEAEGGELKTNNGASRYIFTKRVAQDPVLKQIALATHNSTGHPMAHMVGSIINMYAGGRSFGGIGGGLMATGGNLDNAMGAPMSAPVVITTATDPAVIQLISDVNTHVAQVKDYVTATNNRIDNLKVAVPVDQVTDVQNKTAEVRTAGLF